MKSQPIMTEVKISFIEGLRDVVAREVRRMPQLQPTTWSADLLYAHDVETLSPLLQLRSVTRIFLVRRGAELHPGHLVRHKSLIGELITRVQKESPDTFHTFSISCAGRMSVEVRNIAQYIHETFRLNEHDDADMKIHIVKHDDVWEIGVQCTARPLSVRPYRVRHMEGGLDATIAYALNDLLKVTSAHGYLNPFSGSGTLMIEAALANPALSPISGFDADGATIPIALANLRRAGVAKRVSLRCQELTEAVYNQDFDCVAADIPFGMSISKGEDLAALYESFSAVARRALRPGGRVGVVTTKSDIYEVAAKKHSFTIRQVVPLRFMSGGGSYLTPSIIIAE